MYCARWYSTCPLPRPGKVRVNTNHGPGPPPLDPRHPSRPVPAVRPGVQARHGPSRGRQRTPVAQGRPAVPAHRGAGDDRDARRFSVGMGIGARPDRCPFRSAHRAIVGGVMCKRNRGRHPVQLAPMMTPSWRITFSASRPSFSRTDARRRRACGRPHRLWENRHHCRQLDSQAASSADIAR